MARLKRRWRNIPPLNRKAIVRRIRNLICRDVERVDINKLLKSVFTKKFDFGMHEMAIDYPHKSAIVNSIARELMALKRKEHQSGAFRALVSACARGNLPVAELARQLKIHRNTAKSVSPQINQFYFKNFSESFEIKAIMWGISRVKSRHYRKIVRNAVIKRKRKANEIDEGCKRFMEDAFTPSRYPPPLSLFIY